MVEVSSWHSYRIYYIIISVNWILHKQLYQILNPLSTSVWWSDLCNIFSILFGELKDLTTAMLSNFLWKNYKNTAIETPICNAWEKHQHCKNFGIWYMCSISFAPINCLSDGELFFNFNPRYFCNLLLWFILWRKKSTVHSHLVPIDCSMVNFCRLNWEKVTHIS